MGREAVRILAARRHPVTFVRFNGNIPIGMALD
jgi:hypothetical protein